MQPEVGMRSPVYRSALAVGSALILFGVLLLAGTADSPVSAERICVDVTVHVTEPPPGATACVPIPSTTLPSTTTTSLP
jgi:hypothetical protein